MSYIDSDTVAAIATPEGEGGIGIVRISGPDAFAVAARCFRPRNPKKTLVSRPGYAAVFGDLILGERVVDECIALVFHAPHSYTGEDTVELQCHGGPLVSHALQLCVAAGARPAAAGEFTRRAFLNGRLSLTQAEAVADAVGAASIGGATAAVNLMRGALYRRAEEIRSEIALAAAAMSASIEFPEEGEGCAETGPAAEAANRAAAGIRALLATYDGGAAVLRGVPAILAGSPNVGKSTLMNLLCGSDKAIVTATPGTTRDLLEQRIRVGKVTLLLADSAGLRETGDEIEREGVRRALERLDASALVLAVFDCSRTPAEADLQLAQRLEHCRSVVIFNKNDLPEAAGFEALRARFPEAVTLAAKDLAAPPEALIRAVEAACGADTLSPDEPIVANERQRGCLQRALASLEEASDAAALGEPSDIVHFLLTEAIGALCELSGEDVPETVLDEVFSNFCVGK